MLWFSINFFPISWSINCSIDSLINLPLVSILFTHIEVLNSLVGVLLLVFYKVLMKFCLFMEFFVPLIWVCHHCRWRHTWHSSQMSREASLACHTYCLKSHPFVWPFPSTHNMLPSVWQCNENVLQTEPTGRTLPIFINLMMVWQILYVIKYIFYK